MLRKSAPASAFAVLLALTFLAIIAGTLAAAQPGDPRFKPAKPAQAVLGDEGQRRVAQFETVRLDDQKASETRSRLSNVFRQYPPTLQEVLRLDPSLLTNEAYLAPYPMLAAFLTQHPEVAHNPAYFIGEFRLNEADPQRERIRAWESTLVGFEVLLGAITLFLVLGSLLKSLIEHGRWLRASKAQTEVHAKIMDRMTSNEDLMAYMQSPAGRRFLESAPIAIDAGPRPMSAPIGRILWSVQAGLIAALGGVALLYVSARMAAEGSLSSEMSPPLFLIGMLALAIGVGFVLSAVVAYMLSHRLGLFQRPAVAPHA